MKLKRLKPIFMRLESTLGWIIGARMLVMTGPGGGNNSLIFLGGWIYRLIETRDSARVVEVTYRVLFREGVISFHEREG